KICDVSSTEYRAPDLRDMFLRFTGTDADTANVRAIGSRQMDAIQEITGSFISRPTSAPGAALLFAGGAFRSSAGNEETNPVNQGAEFYPSYSVSFSASRVARASVETRALNTAF